MSAPNRHQHKRRQGLTQWCTRSAAFYPDLSGEDAVLALPNARFDCEPSASEAGSAATGRQSQPTLGVGAGVTSPDAGASRAEQPAHHDSHQRMAVPLRRVGSGATAKRTTALATTQHTARRPR